MVKAACDELGLSRREYSISRSPCGRLRWWRLILGTAEEGGEGESGRSITRVAVSSRSSTMSSFSGRRWFVLYGDVERVPEDARGRSGIAGSEPSSIARTCR